MKKNKKDVRKIKKGCIDSYYSLKLETKLKYEQLCEYIAEKVSKTISEYKIQAEATFKEEIEKSISDLDLKELKELNLKTNHEHKKNEKKLDSAIFSNAIEKIELELTDRGIKIIPVLDLERELAEIQGESESDYEVCSRIYGSAFVCNCDRINLPSLKVKLINDEIVFLRAMLYIFTNGMMVLRISLPIQNVKITPLFEKETDKYIKEIIDEYNIGIDKSKNNMEEIKNAYLGYIKNGNKKIRNIVYTPATLENIILADYDEMPEKVTNLDSKTIEDLYKIAVAPIKRRKDDDLFIDKATEYINKNSEIFDVVKYITSSMGRCVSIVNKNGIIASNGKMTEDERYKHLINAIRINIEFALIIIMLKKINSGYTLLQKKLKSNNIHKIQEEYLYNNIFIIELQQSCYGSVKDQIAFLEEKLSHYLATKENTEKMASIDTIIIEKRARKNLKFQNFLAVGGVLLTAIFGLPAISETLTFLKEVFIPNIDIPIISIENFSVISWFVLLLLISIKIIINEFFDNN